MSRKIYRCVQMSAATIAFLATIIFRGSRAFTIKPLSKEEDEMKKDTLRTMDAIRNSMLTKLDFVKDTANNAEQDVVQVMKDFIYSLNKEQRRNERIRKIQYIAIGVGATAAAIGLASFLLMPKKKKSEVKKMRKDIEQTVDHVANKIEDSGRYLKYKTADTAEDFSDKARHAVETLKEKTADTAERISDKTEHAAETLKGKAEDTAKNISDKTEHAVETLKDKTADTAEHLSDKTEHAVNTIKEKTADTYEKAKDDLEFFGKEVKDTAKHVKKEWEKPVQTK